MWLRGFGRPQLATHGVTRLSKQRVQLRTLLAGGHWDQHVMARERGEIGLSHTWSSSHLRRIKAVSPARHGVLQGDFYLTWSKPVPVQRQQSASPRSAEHYATAAMPQRRCLRLSWAEGTRQLLSTGAGSFNLGWHHSCPRGSHPCRNFWTSPQPQRLGYRH